MSTWPEGALIHITFTYEDVASIAEDLGVDLQTARDRAYNWADNISDTAVSLINEQLASVIEHDTP